MANRLSTKMIRRASVIALMGAAVVGVGGSAHAVPVTTVPCGPEGADLEICGEDPASYPPRSIVPVPTTTTIVTTTTVGGGGGGGGATPPPATTTTTQLAQVPPGQIPKTGSDSTLGGLQLGIGVLALGGGLLAVSRRRRNTSLAT